MQDNELISQITASVLASDADDREPSKTTVNTSLSSTRTTETAFSGTELPRANFPALFSLINLV